jgi:hypothetical protein
MSYKYHILEYVDGCTMIYRSFPDPGNYNPIFGFSLEYLSQDKGIHEWGSWCRSFKTDIRDIFCDSDPVESHREVTEQEVKNYILVRKLMK